MFDSDAAFYILSYATVTGVVLVVPVLGVIWASRITDDGRRDAACIAPLVHRCCLAVGTRVLAALR
jgi:hypothetical protein